MSKPNRIAEIMDIEYGECEVCGDRYRPMNDEEQYVNYQSICETGRCLDCLEEFGLTFFPDQV